MLEKEEVLLSRSRSMDGAGTKKVIPVLPWYGMQQIIANEQNKKVMYFSPVRRCQTKNKTADTLISVTYSGVRQSQKLRRSSLVWYVLPVARYLYVLYS